MPGKRLTESHPFMKKVREVEQLCDKLGINIITSYNGLRIIDTSNSTEYMYRDIEIGTYGNCCDSFPYMTETKLVIED